MVDARDPKKPEVPQRPAGDNVVETGARPDAGDAEAAAVETGARPDAEAIPVEIGGRKGPDPTRYGDWEKGGRCIDF